LDIYVKKGLKRIPLHALAYAGVVGTTAYILWNYHVGHYLLIPGLGGVAAAFGKELYEQFTIGQVWSEFWIDSLAQSAGVGLGILAMKLVV
jgi:hypothetical protein